MSALGHARRRHDKVASQPGFLVQFNTNLLDAAWPAAHLAAIGAATRLHAATRVDRVGDSAWATTYRLSDGDAKAFLKLLPQCQRDQIPRLRTLAECLPESGPTLLATSEADCWILTADHGGRDTRTYDAHDERPTMLRHYAALQAKAVGTPRLMAALEPVDLVAVVRGFRDFLHRRDEPADGTAAAVGAAYFVGEAAAARYRRLFAQRLPLLEGLVERARVLRPTLCHGDLQLRNIAMRKRREPVIFDWDDVSAGPAGLCLHGLLDGCAAALVALRQVATRGAAARSPAARAVNAYIRALSGAGYAPRRALLEGLPGAAVAGTMRFISSFGRFPGDVSRSDSAATIAAKCSELLDACDWLACQGPAAVAMADEYERAGEWHRAQRIVQDQLSRLDPQPVDLLLRFARLSHAAGDAMAAEQASREVLERDPRSLEARLVLGRALLERLALDEVEAVVSGALEVDPRSLEARTIRRRARAFSRLRRISESPRGWPRLSVTPEERARGWLAPETHAMAVELFRRQGAIQLDGVFEPERVQRLQELFLQRYQQHFHDGRHPDALQVGDKRYMLTVELDEYFGAREFIASGLLMPLIREFVGDDCILSAYTVVASLPGSVDQNIHRDHTPLFERDAPDVRYPTFAAQVILPLVPLDAKTGATRMIKGTQWTDLHDAAKRPYQDPVVPLGSCLINDYLCPHYGRGNRSSRVRPIATYIYTRPWFRDFLNYRNQAPLRAVPGFLENSSPEVRALLDWWDRERKLAVRDA